MANNVFWAALCLFGITSLSYWTIFSPRSECSVTRWLIAAFLPILIAVRGMRRNSLDFSGGMLSIAMGFLLTIANAAYCVSIIVFYLSSSRLTKWKSEEKRKIEVDFKEGRCDKM